MKKSIALFIASFLITGMLSGCVSRNEGKNGSSISAENYSGQGTQIVLSDDGVTVNGRAAVNDRSKAVYTANDIVYYEDGHDFAYGEGTQSDAHSRQEAKAHTVVHISRPGEYVLSGTLSQGQIAVDLGDGAGEDPQAVVTLVLNGVDITCKVAPAIIFYNVYECGSADLAAAVKEVDTTAAGANIIIADDSINTVCGAYVARIYKPGSVVLNDAGTKVKEAKKLHKYDGAVYSRMSMNVDAGEEGSGMLYINGENEGLDTELHLTINGGNISIIAGNDGINTNEEYVSVITINGGALSIRVDGATGEGDGIDSNGWLVINGGSVLAQGCSAGIDSGIDSDMGIHINGGTVAASGNMFDCIGQSGQSFAVFQFVASQEGGLYTLMDAAGAVAAQCNIENRFYYLIMSCENLVEGEYSLWHGDVRLKGIRCEGGSMSKSRMMPPGEEHGFDSPAVDESSADASEVFEIRSGENYFISVRTAEDPD